MNWYFNIPNEEVQLEILIATQEFPGRNEKRERTKKKEEKSFDGNPSINNKHVPPSKEYDVARNLMIW